MSPNDIVQRADQKYRNPNRQPETPDNQTPPRSTGAAQRTIRERNGAFRLESRSNRYKRSDTGQPQEREDYSPLKHRIYFSLAGHFHFVSAQISLSWGPLPVD
ncbi:hypothetical protein [Candidatus Binatus sp.]|uniref:hypothetical protein n=1 Tax=Candidatus Binatus sp. TaxID=2811406 RepID=UPI003C70BDC8